MHLLEDLVICLGLPIVKVVLCLSLVSLDSSLLRIKVIDSEPGEECEELDSKGRDASIIKLDVSKICDTQLFDVLPVFLDMSNKPLPNRLIVRVIFIRAIEVPFVGGP